MPSAPWRIAFASEVGTSHEGAGTPCQDSAGHAIAETLEGPVLIAAISDGAGSAAHSDVGSSIAVTAFISDVELFIAQGGQVSGIDAGRASRWVRRAAESASAAAEANEHEVHDYCCTLLAAVVGAEHAAFIQVGDGAIVVSHGDDDGWSYVFWPQHGEFANTTNFIQSPDIDSVLAFELAPRRIDELAIFSDGIENLVLDKASRSVHQSFFQEMIQPVRKTEVTGLDGELSQGLRRYLASPLICERTDDDKTLVLASRALPVVSTNEPSPA
jgi:Protein phosphatase 2C